MRIYKKKIIPGITDEDSRLKFLAAQRNAKWYAKIPEETKRAKSRDKMARDKARILAMTPEEKEARRLKINEQQKALREKNPERNKIHCYRFYSNNKMHVRCYSREYARRKRRDDVKFKLLQTLRSQLYINVKNRSKSTRALVGCTIDELIIHLESKFMDGMSWGNHSRNGWHIDHIRPCASFDLEDPDQQKKCFNYTNLQPLWAVDNRKKGAKWFSK